MKGSQKSPKQFRQETPENGGASVAHDLKDLSKGSLDSLLKDMLKSAPQDILSQITGTEFSDPKNRGGELAEGTEISLLEEQTEEKKDELIHTQKHLEYFRKDVEHAGEQIDEKESMILRQQIDEIRAEIKRIEQTSSEIRVLSQAVATEPTPQRVGKYHVSFFEFVLTSLRRARTTMENSASFMKVLSNKRSQQKYWNQAKGKGSSFTLHHDRSVATQTG